jgi:monovalent cation/proton antiporter MnhG/PhaG subunit
VSAALVIAGVAVLAFACAGVVAMPRPLARLHYVSVGSLGLLLVAAAVVVADGASLMSVKAATLAVFVTATSPVLAHAVARAIHNREERRR